MTSTHDRQLVAVLGRGVVDRSTPLLTADDLGITRGDGCFDATRVVVDDAGRRVDHLERHLARFARSWQLLDLGVPDLDAWRGLIGEAVAAWDVPGSATLKLLATRGVEHPAGQPTQLLTITPHEPPGRPLDVVTLTRGYASNAFSNAPWLLGGVKSLSYAVNVAATREARRRGADDVLFTSADGFCLEGPTSALVTSLGGEMVLTPDGGTGILPSITAAVVCEGLRAAGVRVVERLLRPADLYDADGAWLVSSIRGVCPIAHLDGRPLTRDRPRTREFERLAGY